MKMQDKIINQKNEVIKYILVVILNCNIVDILMTQKNSGNT